MPFNFLLNHVARCTMNSSYEHILYTRRSTKKKRVSSFSHFLFVFLVFGLVCVFSDVSWVLQAVTVKLLLNVEVPFLVFRGVLLVAVGGPFRLRVLVKLDRKVSTLFEVHVEVERRIGDLFGRDGHGLEESEEFPPFGLCLRVAEFGPRATLLKRKPAGLNADRVHRIIPRTVVLHRNCELHGVLLVLFRGRARERHDGVDGNVLERLKECEAAERVEEVRETVLAGAVDATLRLVGAPVAVAVGALEDERADVLDVLDVLDGLHGGVGWLAVLGVLCSVSL